MGRLHPHAGGARVPDRKQALRLDVRVGARAVHARSPRLSRARQGARRLELDQRHDLPARQPARLRALGRRCRHGDVGLRALPPVLQADGELSRRRRRLSRRRRSARAGARTGRRAALRRVLRRGAAGRLSADGRRQRTKAGGFRQVRSHDLTRPAAERGARISASGHVAAEPRGALPRVRGPRRVRRSTCGRCRGRRRDRARERGRSSAAARSTRRSCSSSPASATRTSCRRSASTSCTICPASARTSRTTSRCTCSTRARSRCRCSRR